ncbi:hypothetical protein PUNSTDRAFT_118740 [Punctularia strigosozonata HHB-11173 SS5]|uniref:uncharacterized protein n=1 Tax=Punctularia strigosozonata (strain HHB-11173) TaxID=741275 RepID=UPI000441817F|nr:uncharacterized protein PUNSTDRAFT_118740 [Punctularia strigosozonata HHB-11173 SS5]EIN11246.1 hypothetical protein PUNSTDRAFT_118740 [Punctularia strigosozonata HHB-11173 SS5]
MNQRCPRRQCGESLPAKNRLEPLFSTFTIRSGLSTEQHDILVPRETLHRAEECAQCRLGFLSADKKVVLTSCGQRFHPTCFELLCNSEKKCPRCRQRLSRDILARVAVMTAGVSIVGGALLAPVLAPAAVGMARVSAAGSVAGSLAGGIQSGLQNVASGSLLATCQRIATGGALPAAWTAVSGKLLGGRAVL